MKLKCAVKKLMNSKMLQLLNSFALLFVIQSANSACCWLFHQPEFPEEATTLGEHSLCWYAFMYASPWNFE